MKSLLASTLIFLSCITFAGDDSWVPEVKFDLEGGSYIETLHWVSGNSYAYSSMVKEMRSAKIYCTDSVGSKDLLDILNSEFSGKRITSEQASLAIKATLPKRFVCTK